MTLKPVYEVKVDSVPILKIWKNDGKHLKKNYNLEKKSSVFENCVPDVTAG
jgi:hypothetical protein